MGVHSLFLCLLAATQCLTEVPPVSDPFQVKPDSPVTQVGNDHIDVGISSEPVIGDSAQPRPVDDKMIASGWHQCHSSK
jgi:hypothetical protein